MIKRIKNKIIYLYYRWKFRKNWNVIYSEANKVLEKYIQDMAKIILMKNKTTKLIENNSFDTDMNWIKNGNDWETDNDIKRNDVVIFSHPIASFTISNYVAGKILFNGKQIKIEKTK